MLARLRFLQCCERLGIPDEKWPIAEFFSKPLGNPDPDSRHIIVTDPVPVPVPEYDLERDSPETWKPKADAIWETHRDEFLEYCAHRQREMVERGDLVPVPQPRQGRDIIPFGIRYEMAVRHHCLRQTFREIGAGYKQGWNADQVKAAVYRVLDEVGLTKKQLSRNGK